MKVLILTILSLLPSNSVSQDLQFQDDLIKFHNTYAEFVRIYFGCPKHAISIDECSETNAKFDYTLWVKTQKYAQPLFGKN